MPVLLKQACEICMGNTTHLTFTFICGKILQVFGENIVYKECNNEYHDA